jgi:nitrate reductase molybdenum cofactor assembly chaperone NarJ/NarW
VVTVTATDRARTLELLGALLDYPRPGLTRQARECRDLVAAESPGAAGLIATFLADLEALPTERLEELYSGAFDLTMTVDADATCYPYVGHHLFGESYRRSRFMAGLVERYRAHGFDAGTELPDHVAVMLRFLAYCEDEEPAEELVSDALLPALGRMTLDGEAAGSDGRGGREIYLRLLEATRLALSEALWPGTAAASYFDVPTPAGVAS